MRTVNTWLEVISGLTRLERRTGMFRIVSNKNDGLTTFSPVGEQPTDVIFAGEVVARAKNGFVETVLDVNHNQGIRHDTTVSLGRNQNFGKVSLTSFHREILG